MCMHTHIHIHKACVSRMSVWDMVHLAWPWTCRAGSGHRESTLAVLSWKHYNSFEWKPPEHSQMSGMGKGCGQGVRQVLRLLALLTHPYSIVAEGPSCVLPPLN